MISFVINPVAGKGKAMDIVQDIERKLPEHGLDYEILISEYPRHTVVLTREAVARGASCVVAVGGDGTVTEVAREALAGGVKLGIIPRGTGNDLAKPLGIPKEIGEALDVICAGRTMRMDVGDLSGEKFFNSAGVGFDVDVVIRSRRYKNRVGGQGAYILGVITAILGAKPIRMHIAGNGYDHDRDILLLTVANGPYFGGGMKVAPQAELDDGKFDVCAISYLPRYKIPLLLPKFIKGTHLSLKVCEYFKTDKLVIETKFPVMLQMDGEIAEFNRLEYTLLKNALEVVVP